MASSKVAGVKHEKNVNKYMVLDIEVIPEKIEDTNIREYLMDKNFPRKLHPMFARVVVIGYKLANGRTELLYHKDESELLTNLWTVIANVRPDVVVTFNGYNFDVPFLNIRSHIKSIPPSMEINLNKWKLEASNHFDCMQVLSANQTFLNVALEIICRKFKIPVPENRLFGEEVPKLYETGDLEAIKEHCRQDVELTEQLYLKLKKSM